MNKKQKLELTWIGKENRPKLEPHILLEDPAKSYHAKHRLSENELFDNKKPKIYWSNSGETRRLHPLQQPT
jgi:hypothetical protein